MKNNKLIYIKINHFLGNVYILNLLTKVKLILIIFSLIYLVALIAIYYFMFIFYQETMDYINSTRLYDFNKDLVRLLYYHPLTSNINFIYYKS